LPFSSLDLDTSEPQKDELLLKNRVANMSNGGRVLGNLDPILDLKNNQHTSIITEDGVSGPKDFTESWCIFVARTIQKWFQRESARSEEKEGQKISQVEAEALSGLLQAALKYDTKERLTAEEMLRHPWFSKNF